MLMTVRFAKLWKIASITHQKWKCLDNLLWNRNFSLDADKILKVLRRLLQFLKPSYLKPGVIAYQRIKIHEQYYQQPPHYFEFLVFFHSCFNAMTRKYDTSCNCHLRSPIARIQKWHIEIVSFIPLAPVWIFTEWARSIKWGLVRG